MKVHYSKILLFPLLLNILAHNKNKTYITAPTLTTTSRVLSECKIQTSIYDNDPEMRSVKENFDRQTSQRFEEYDERMKDKRRKYKEQCDKDIQQIILKDKVEKSLSEKVEKVCLKCGCGLGGVAAGVGIIGPAAVKGLENAALLAAAEKGIKAGISKAIFGLENAFRLDNLGGIPLDKIITAKNFKDVNILGQLMQKEYIRMLDAGTISDNTIFSLYESLGGSKTTMAISANARTAAINAAAEASQVEGVEIAAVNAASYNSYIAIAYSVIAILIILLVIVIIYLILRYHRRKKMNKKLQYTKLLNQ
ncbi:rifin [Plasmodium sp. gorilla clade G1]|nr:rifin [Plasmodium sp. gorilla clade G1]